MQKVDAWSFEEILANSVKEGLLQMEEVLSMSSLAIAKPSGRQRAAQTTVRP